MQGNSGSCYGIHHCSHDHLLSNLMFVIIEETFRNNLIIGVRRVFCEVR